jgi:lysophospholipid acyltransferase (LPLAT)-like uncharacterized protein
MRGHDVIVLVSQHRDGEYITQTIHRLGYDTVRGSTTRGGFRSLLEMANLARTGRRVAITPDGPRGPRHQVQPGAILIAQRSGVPILPMACATWPQRQLGSWDRFEIPAPFARMVLGFGPALQLPGDRNSEQLVQEWSPRLREGILAVRQQTRQALDQWRGRA